MISKRTLAANILVRVGVVIVWVAVSLGSESTGVSAEDAPKLKTMPGDLSLPTVESSSADQDLAFWNFERPNDLNSDRFPDQWQRRQSVGYPDYVDAGIVGRDERLQKDIETFDSEITFAWQEFRRWAQSNFVTLAPSLPPLPPSIADVVVDHYFRVTMDGGRFQARSPVVPAGPTYKYQFQCEMKYRGLQHDSAFVELVFVDSNNNELAVRQTNRLNGNSDWTTHVIGSISAPIGTTGMFVRLNVVGSDDGVEDIDAVVGFDNLVIERFPQVQMKPDRRFGVFRPDNTVTMLVQAMGVDAHAKAVELTLIDHENKVLQKSIETIDRQVSPPSTRWVLGKLQPGYYRVIATVVDDAEKKSNRSKLGTESSFAVLNPQLDGLPHGPFGWSLKEPIADDISPSEFSAFLNDSGIAWLKYPCWVDGDDNAKIERIATILGRVQDDGIQVVGRLDHPTEKSLLLYPARDRQEDSAAAYFRDLGTWQPMLEPVMNRLSLKIRKWQLGADGDFSFLDQGRLKEQISEIGTGLQGFGQPLEIALPWPWLEEPLPAPESSWQAVCHSVEPPLAADELDATLRMMPRGVEGGPENWIIVNPIGRDRYDRTARAADMVLRMAAVRSHRVSAAFIDDPYDPVAGILHPNGQPDELYLPWRTTSRLLGQRRFAGSLDLPSRAFNRIFTDKDTAVWMVWSPSPMVEEIYLGEDVRQIDLWGRMSPIETVVRGREVRHRIPIGPTPKFIVGVDPMLMAFRMSVELPNTQLDSLLGQRQTLAVKFKNPNRENMVGTLRIQPPRTWQISKSAQTWELLSGQSQTLPFDVVLANTAQIGTYQVPLEFELETIPPRTITIVREVHLGPQGLTVTASTKLLRNGDLKVTVEMTNHSASELSYDCLLFPPPGRQYQMRYLTIPPGESISREFHWPEGAELVGNRMLLRAVEQDANRVLNYPIEIVR
jgi:hypothetical protein